MPRETAPSKSLVQIPSNSMVASMLRFDQSNEVDRIYLPPKEWQRECYRHYEICGEARFAARYMGNALSRIVLKAGRLEPDNSVKVMTTGAAKAELDALFNGQAGQSQMLSAVGVHLTVAGECWLYGKKGADGAPDVWEVLSCLELNVTGDKKTWTVEYHDGRAPQPVDFRSEVMIRVWLPHPARRIEADSPFRSLLPVLGEIEYMTKHIFAQTRSRLASAGILPIPDSVTFPTEMPGVDTSKMSKEANDIDRFMKMLATVMAATLSNQGHPSSLVPIMVKMPAEAIQHLKLLEFWTKLDENAQTIRSNAIQRFFLGMDLPPEQMQGIGSSPGTGGGRSTGVSHWGGWQIEEQTIKMHVEPMAEVLVNALVLGYIRVNTGNLKDTLIADTSNLRMRPDRSELAKSLNEAGILKDQVVAREGGFDDKDMMNEEERRWWLLRKIAGGSATPDQVAAAARQLGVELPGAAVLPGAVPQQAREARPDPTSEDLPNRERTPERPPELLPVANAIVVRALERSGNRIRQAARSAGVDLRNTPAWSAHTAYACNGTTATYMADTLDTAEMLLDGVVSDVPTVTAALHAYCFDLISTGKPHTKDALSEFLEAAGC